MSSNEKPAQTGRRKKKGLLRDVALNMRVTQDSKDLLGLITERMKEPSDTQTIVRLIDEKATELGISLPPKTEE